jgi:hypothetical protein
MENVYVYKFRGVRTGWDYKVVFKKSGTVEIADITEIDLPRGSVKIGKTAWKFDKYPLGMRSTKTLEGEIDLSMLKGSDYDEFVAMLYDPLTLFTRSLSGHTFNYWAGTKIELYIKFNRNSDPSINVYRSVFDGAIREDQDVEVGSGMSKIYNITAEDVGRCSTDSIGFEGLSSFNSIDDSERMGYLEFYSNGSPKKAVFQKPGENYTIYFQPIAVLERYIKELARAIYRDTARDQSAEFNFDLPLPKLYKQLYTGSNARGVELVADDIFIASTIFFDETTPMGGLSIQSDQNSIARQFQSIWDFLSDHLEQNLKKGWFEGNTFYATSIFGSVGAEAIVSIDLNRVSATFKQSSGLLKKAVSSVYETHGEDVSDMDSYTAELPASRNSNEYSIATFLMPQPEQSKFKGSGAVVMAGEATPEMIAYMTKHGVTFGDKIHIGDSPRVQGLYYKETASPITNALGEFVRCHQSPVISIAPGVTTDDIEPFVPETVSSYTSANELVALLQANHSQIVIAAEALLKVFSNKQQHTVKMTANIEYLTDYQPGGSAGFVWDRPDIVFDIDMAQYDSRKVVDFTKYYILSSEIDYENETATVEAIMRTI